MTEFLMSFIGAAGLVFHQRPYRYLALGLFALALAVYVFTLPAAYTGGVIGLISLRTLTAELLFFALALSALLSLALTLNIYAFRASLRRRGSGLTFGAVIASLLPAGICCTPLVPTLLAILGASTPQIFGLTGRIQGVFATYEPLFLSVALILLLFSLRLVTRNVLASCALPERGIPADDPAQEEAPH